MRSYLVVCHLTPSLLIQFKTCWIGLELQRRLEDFEPNIRNNRVQSQVRTKLADAKSAIWAIALGILVRYFHMDFYDAWDLIDSRVPISSIDPGHISQLKKLFSVTVP
jgi:hypothetical protein